MNFEDFSTNYRSSKPPDELRKIVLENIRKQSRVSGIESSFIDRFLEKRIFKFAWLGSITAMALLLLLWDPPPPGAAEIRQRNISTNGDIYSSFGLGIYKKSHSSGDSMISYRHNLSLILQEKAS